MHDNDFIKKSGYLPDAGALTQELMTKVAGADLGEGCRGCAPQMTPDDLRFSNTTGILRKKKLCGLLVLK